jgi:polysaccharide deacetylase 2 family uncharacterized protein YibQ
MRRVSAPVLIIVPIAALVIVFLIVQRSRDVPAEKTTARGPSAPEVAPKLEAVGVEGGAHAPRAAVIIDDMGYSFEAIDALCRLGFPVTVSILPFTPLGKETAARAAACGLETMLHLPFESLAAKDGGPSSLEGTILTRMNAEAIRRTVEENLRELPGVRGINNHTGSKFTEEAAVLQPILDVLEARGLYFIDSRTSKNSVAYEEAVRRGVRTARRQVFIDADSDPDGVRRRLVELFTFAKEHGKAVGIAHPREKILEALALHLGLAEEMGVRLVFASAIVD